MEEQTRATKISVQQKPVKEWYNIALLNHFNCFAVSQTRNNGQDDVERSCKKETRGGWRTMPYIIGNASCERVALAASQTNMIVYLTTKYNMKKVAAISVLNVWSGTTSLASLPGAFVADSYLGKFRTIVIGCFSYLVGLCLLTLTALIPQFRPSHCNAPQKKLGNCERASKGQWTLLMLVLLFKLIGSAGVRPCSMAFGADQFQQEGEEGKGSKEKNRIESFFNWYYFSMSVSLLLAVTVIIYIQSSVSWGLGFGICTLLMLISTLVFVAGASLYRHDSPEGSPFTGFAQVIVASIRKWNLSLPSDAAKLYHGQSCSNTPVTDRLRFLNKAAIITEKDILSDGSVSNPWRLSSSSQIETLKAIIATLPIFSCGIASSITMSQLHSFSVLQALTMNRHLGSGSFEIPAASFSVFSQLVVIAWIPLYDRFIVPAARQMTKNGRGITVFQRMGIGYAISTLSMVVSGFIEVKRRKTALRHGLADDSSAIVPISALWLVPQFCIMGLGEAFHTVGHLEFFYAEFPPTMRSTAIALSSCTSAVGHYMSTILLNVVHAKTGRHGKPDWLDDNLNLGRLNYFYWLLAAIEAVNLVYFIICASLYKCSEFPVQDPVFESGAQEMETKHMLENEPECKIGPLLNIAH